MSENESKDHAILKVFYVLLFYIIYGFTDVVILLITLVQTLLNVFGSGPSESLVRFGSSLGVYVKHIAEYVSYASDHKPFPFDDWPEPNVDDQA